MIPKVLYQFPKLAGELFRPSNGTEGMIFMDAFCEHCIHDHPDPDNRKKCDILCRSLMFDQRDKEYPQEWRFNSEGYPVCTAWVKWDWNNDGDPDDPDNPNKPPDPPDPNQLHLFPLYPNEITLDGVERAREVING